MKVNTGYGYFTKDGKIIAKYDLPIGEHPLKDGYGFVEVNSLSALDSVVVDEEPLSAEELHKIEINKELTAMAEASLKAKEKVVM
jgi:hypothetical protein